MESDQENLPDTESLATDGNHRIEPGLKQTAVTSTLSFVFGVGALLTLVLVHPALILSVPAIVFGHVAKFTLRQSNGELVGWGKARIGKILGYFSLVAAVLLFFNIDDYRLLLRGVKNSERTVVAKAGEDFSPGGLGEIERRLAAGQTRVFANSETAEKLAAAFRRELRQALNFVLTHRDEKGLGLDTSGVSCYGHVDGDVFFVAAIPDLSQYNGAAEDVLRKAAWQSAVLALREDSQEDEPLDRKLLVALMESARCETVLVGSLNSQSNGAPAPARVEYEVVQIVDILSK